ncbi:DUF4446 family protein [Brevibacillus sp. H7]|uniref:DUF4446 family protein n=1 Tax=Brevibacillus sp. H7 TaxID=3349138 RepID=UPI0037F791F4
MQPLLSFFTTPALLFILAGSNFLLLLFCILLSVRISRQRKSMKRLLSGTDGANLEAGLHRILDHLDEIKKTQADQQYALNQFSQRLASQCANIAVIRYNAFGDIGSDLSFSLAMLDDAQNGVVLTSIYGREESRIFAKPVEGGTSVYNLSEEELAVIQKASRRGK